MNTTQAAQLADTDLVWFETRMKPRFRWQWWGWKKVDDSPVAMRRVRIYYTMAAAPLLMRGIQFRVRKAK